MSCIRLEATAGARPRTVRAAEFDGEEVYEAGQAFYGAPGHAPQALEDSEYVDFSPTKEFNESSSTSSRRGVELGRNPDLLARQTEGCSSRRGEGAASAGHTPPMPPLIEFPADDPDRARRFWHGVLGVTLAPRPRAAGSGWQTDTDGLRLGVHERGPGPGDTASLPYFTVADLPTALKRVRELGGSIIHPGDRWAVCRDSEGNPFALAAAPAPGK
jgi:predicted enzyme related to lactoylglutathione lyase